jgi:type IV pilus assembly protein PilB
MKSHELKLKHELVVRGLLKESQVQRAVDESAKKRLPLRTAVLNMQLLREEQLLSLEADILGVSFLDLDKYLFINDNIVKMVPESVARTYHVMPVFKIGKLTVATNDPSNLLALDDVRNAVGEEVDIVLSTHEMIAHAIDQYYGGIRVSARQTGLAAPNVAGESIYKTEAAGGGGEASLVERETEEVPVIKTVNQLIAQAVAEKASDIHIEPEETIVRVRNRVDGIMHESTTLEKKLHAPIVSRIKIMAKLDIAETRKPQDGKIRLKVEQNDLDIRVSTFPTMHGENIVLRLLEQSKLILGLGDLGIDGELITKINLLIHKPYGMVLVTGPTGAGKTTTLYAALNSINTMDKNIITIEDPVEYQLPIVRQTQVNVKAGLTFANGLRNILRQDPDVVLVGEIRDAETVQVAIEAALTGHLVFSTIHTNDAAGAVTRLVDMQIEPFLISSSLLGVLAQRLVRTICDRCKESYNVEPDMLEKMGIKSRQTKFFRGKGCKECKRTGYAKRIGIFELLVVDEDIRRLVLSKSSAKDIKSMAMKKGMVSIRMDGLRKAEAGLTTIEEVIKATLEED